MTQAARSVLTSRPIWRMLSSLSPLTSSLTPKQKAQLIEIIDECVARGATSAQLAPLLAVVYVLPPPYDELPIDPPNA